MWTEWIRSKEKWETENHEHIGLIVANGDGKSTFMNIITGKLQPDEGKIEWAKHVRVGYLDQHTVLNKEMTVKDVLSSAFSFLFDLEAKMNEMYELMATADEKQLEEYMEVSSWYAMNRIFMRIGSPRYGTAVSGPPKWYKKLCFRKEK